MSSSTVGLLLTSYLRKCACIKVRGMPKASDLDLRLRGTTCNVEWMLISIYMLL